MKRGVCPRCNGRKYIPLENGMAQPCPCVQDSQRARSYELAGIPKYMTTMTWRDWFLNHRNAKPLLPVIRKWERDVMKGTARRCACVAGQSGCGKLTLAYLVMRDFIAAKMSTKVVTLTDLIQDRFEDGELNRVALSVDVLCVRLGVEDDHKWRGSMLEKVHFGRKVEHRPTFYTTRFQAAAFEGAYGDVLRKVFWLPHEDVLVWDLKTGRVVVP